MSDPWPGCYDLSWKDAIVPAAFAHPAKMSRGLLRRILDHAFEQRWVSKGSVVCDPFGGIGSTAIEGAYRGLQVVTCELEPKFVTLAKENMALHARHWTTLGCPQPVILQGDSRKLCEVVKEAGMVVSSPPFTDGSMGDARPQGGMKTKIPHTGISPPGIADYGTTPGQLGAMKAGSVAAVVGSPPFMDQEPSHSQNDSPSKQRLLANATEGRRFIESTYGKTSGQLAALPPGSVSAVLSSPPYEGSLHLNESQEIQIARLTAAGNLKAIEKMGGASGSGNQGYDNSVGQLGNSTGTTFWSAARLIVEQCYQLLPPGGHAVWVCKDFVRNKQRVPFSDDWLRLCEAVGFRLACRHQAMLVKTWKETTLFEGTVTKSKERKSFFRRLAEKKGSPRIDHEDVLCLQRPRGVCVITTV